MAQGGEWTGYGGVGDYRNSNGNTAAVMNEAHRIRDHVFDDPSAEAVDTGETFDCVVVGGGISGLAAALFFHRQAGPRLKCLVLENHPVFGGEAKRNEFMVDGHRLFAQQGSTHFQIPYPHSYLERFYESIGMDYRQFKYQSWGGSEREIPLSRSPYQMLSIEPATYGFYFGAKFRQQPGLWLVDPWGRKLEGAPLPSEMRRELVKWHEAESKNTWTPKLPFAYPGDEVSRRYDSQTLEQVMIQEGGLSQETIRTFFAQETAGGFGLGPDALSGYCKFVWDAFYALDDTPATGWQMFPGGNAGMARLMVKTLIPDSIAGPRTLENVCRNSINFAALDRPSNPARIRLESTVVRVEHEREPEKSSFVWITYTRGGTVHKLKARSVVMAGGSWTTRHIVRDLPSSHRDAYARFYRTPYMVANVAVRNWRFLYKLGISGGRWFEGIGNWTEVRKVATFGTDLKAVGPDSPTVRSPSLPGALQGFCLRSSGKETEMSAYKRGGVYWYDFWFRGIRYRESTGLTNKNAATDAESIRRAELAEGRAGIVHRSPVPKFEDLVKNEFMPWSEKQHETHPRTHQYYRMSSKPLIASLGKLPLDGITTAYVERFKMVRAENVSPASTNRDMAALSLARPKRRPALG